MTAIEPITVNARVTLIARYWDGEQPLLLLMSRATGRMQRSGLRRQVAVGDGARLSLATTCRQDALQVVHGRLWAGAPGRPDDSRYSDKRQKRRLVSSVAVTFCRMLYRTGVVDCQRYDWARRRLFNKATSLFRVTSQASTLVRESKVLLTPVVLTLLSSSLSSWSLSFLKFLGFITVESLYA